jgi:hypothetical protein
MSEWPVHGAFPHQHGDARGLMERIQAQLRERIEKPWRWPRSSSWWTCGHGRRAETTSTTDRCRVRGRLAEALLAWASDAYVADLPTDLLRSFDEAEAAAGDQPARLLTGQVWLARRLPDYWQRFERYQGQYAAKRVADPSAPGWLKRLFG